ncbi:hypothetical protein [Roseomonas sp. CECT 9278]|uniref:hypothetical protein n=1 Tax=Roseomonas sp. CECT 9278 TaxID=2845823 RepID=UPI001E46F53A|nr:hypothetical protein [Roseomonas sp. CECT 9278]CAH0174385.1 hypothetical protein ROS9278_01278 [Roseomonas sp. CECT 9278]
MSGAEGPPASSLLLYQTEDGRTRLECRFADDTLWLTQAQMAELFQTSVPNINIHLPEKAGPCHGMPCCSGPSPKSTPSGADTVSR